MAKNTQNKKQNELDKLYATTDVTPDNNPLVNNERKEDVAAGQSPKKAPADQDGRGREKGKQGKGAHEYDRLVATGAPDEKAKSERHPKRPEKKEKHSFNMEAYDKLYANTDVTSGNNPLVHPDWQERSRSARPMDPKRAPIDNDPYFRHERGAIPRGRQSRYEAYDRMMRQDGIWGPEDGRMPQRGYRELEDDFAEAKAHAKETIERNVERGKERAQAYADVAEERFRSFKDEAQDRYYEARDRFEDAYGTAKDELYSGAREARARWASFYGEAEDRLSAFAEDAQDKWGDVKEAYNEKVHSFRMHADGEEDTFIEKSAIESLTKEAIAEVDGILGLADGLRGQLAAAVGYDASAGIAVRGKEKPLLVLKLILEYGAPGPHVLKQLRQVLKERLKETLDLELDAIQVEVVDVMTQGAYARAEAEKERLRNNRPW